MDETLEQRLQRLTDLEEIRLLKARYCRLSDRGYAGAGDSPDGVADLFTDDGVWGETEGRDAIRSLFRDFQRTRPLAMHFAVNPTIEVDGDRARGTWWGAIPSTTDEGATMVSTGTYDDEFVRTGDGWRFRRLTFVPAFRLPLPGPS